MRFGERLIDYRDARRARIILFRKPSPHEQRNFHRGEKVLAHSVDLGFAFKRLAVWSTTSGRKTELVFALIESSALREKVTDCDSRHRFKSIESLLIEIGELVFFVTDQAWVHIEEK